MKKSLGICIGASTISFVVTTKDNNKINIESHKSIAHGGNPKKLIKDFFSDFDNENISIVVTGRKFRKIINTFSISEPEAIEKSFEFLELAGKYKTIASLGGENFMVYCLDDEGGISNVLTGNKCASGTGEFFLQQIGRMDLDVREALELVKDQEPHSVSGRCSVFCKSDCTHALNKGVPKGSVASGLCQMIAGKIIELLSKQNSKDVLVIGGVSQNDEVIKFLKGKYPDAYIPDQSPYFEALGASLVGLKKESKIDKDNIFTKQNSNFTFLEPIKGNESKVTFKEINRGTANSGDQCVLGLDVGSTTTKAVIIRLSDNALIASTYLRTSGNPVGASINCYKELQKQINQPIEIVGLGTTGSGRHIAGLHALTEGVINEIIAHAVAAAHFDDDVDTIFEIGGQDAKYTHLTNGIASDYAMNEACSAGTGSFLEEAAKESLNIDYRDIADIALQADNPPNFNDQCAAFISSDIKNAGQEGISQKDIVAGLVYSICMNYTNRVKGNRTVGNKVFMQGGVCYNRAVPIAMSILINKEIVVPPEPGLMGAFGVALEVKNRIGLGLLKKGDFKLEELINREFKYGNEFICAGGAEKCDRKCKIAMIEVEGNKYPFGGSCNKYFNQRLNIQSNPEKNDYVKIRQNLVFEKYANLPSGSGKTIGIPRSFLVNTLYPLYYNFFTKLGFRVVLSDAIDSRGIAKVQSSFCYPVEISHGVFQNLLDKNPDYIFLPHITQMKNKDDNHHKRTCVFTQGEVYYIKSAFSDEKLPPILSPVIDFMLSDNEVSKVFVSIAKELSKDPEDAKKAFDFANSKLQEMLKEFKQQGRKALDELESDRNRFGVVLFGRSYNTFAKEGNLSIPHKFASKNIIVIPHDFISSEDYHSQEHMYWYAGQQILKSSRFVKDHPQLFGTFITNFSCGPDSFLISYFRRIMKSKPSLTLELDSHSADVGVDTRIDAAIDIIKNYLELKKQGNLTETENNFKPLEVVTRKKRPVVIDQYGKEYSMTSKEVEVVVPSMGRFGSEALVATFKSVGVNAKSLGIPTFETLKYGRSHTSCKECLPYILTTGSMVEYIKEQASKDKKILFFMPHGGGPCRQGQYFIKLRDVIASLKLENVGILSLNDENSYGGFGNKFFLRGWMSVVISDTLGDMENALTALAIDRDRGLEVLDTQWNKLKDEIEKGSTLSIINQLKELASEVSKVELKTPLSKAKIVSLIGEAYVRREEFSRLDLMEVLAEKDFVVRVAPVAEYIYYCNFLAKIGMRGTKISITERVKLFFQDMFQEYMENKIKKILKESGLVEDHMLKIKKTVSHGKHHIAKDLLGEGILTVGSALREVIDDTCGIISIGPFACMPSRLAEAILNKEMTLKGKIRAGGDKIYPDGISSLPYLHIETDGNPFPQITQSKIEIFMLQASKLNKIIKS